MLLETKNLIRCQIMHKKTSFDLKVREILTIEDLKSQIEKHENITMTYYYLFYDNLNLLDTYNSFTIKHILELTGRQFPSDQDSDFIFYLVNREDYRDLAEQINCLRCETHSYNTAYLFCSTCQLLICDQCKFGEHKGHKQITDQTLSLDAYFMKLQQYEKKIRNLFGKSKESDVKKICVSMDENLSEYIEKEKTEIKHLAEEMKDIIDRIKELELERIEKFFETGRNKILEFSNETSLVFKIYKECNEGLKTREKDINNFGKWKNEKKVDYLRRIQNKDSDLLQKSGRIEKIMEKFQNVQDYDIFKLLETNKDYSYSITFTKLKQIFEKKLRKSESRLNSESCELLINKMENMKSKISNSKVYNKLLNLSENNNSNAGKSISVILQPIDLTPSVNIFNILEKRIYSQDVNFIINKNITDVNAFPKFCRSININNKLYVTGGENEKSIVNYLIEVDCNTLEAKLKKGMDYRRSAHTVVNISNLKIIAISGAYGEVSCESYSIENNRWTALPNVKEDRVGSSALVYCSESIFLFFGKRYDSANRKWIFVDTIEKINLFEQSPTWTEINFKSTNLDVSRERAFGSIIACPNEKVYIVGGQTMQEGNIELTSSVLEIDTENLTLGVTNLLMPKPVCFVETNFYFNYSNGINFDNEGAIILYSVIFNEMWHLENY